MPHQSYVANASIHCSRAVKIVAGAGGQALVVEAGAGEQAIGISQPGTRRVPGFTDTSTTDAICAVAGETLRVHMQGETNVPAEAGGTFAAGDLLKSGALGVLVKTAAAEDKIIAIAEQAGAVGKIVP